MDIYGKLSSDDENKFALPPEVAEDRLITLISVLFNEARLDYRSELTFDTDGVVQLLKVWYAETYNEVLEYLKEKEGEKDNGETD